jgi:hypothetical protein
MKYISARLTAIVFLFALCNTVTGAPPDSCINKFVGTWTIVVKSTGQTYPAQINADGTANARCPNCMASQRWTCDGNKMIILDPYRFESILSADGDKTDSACCYGTRVGAAPQTALTPNPETVSASAQCDAGTAGWARSYLIAARAVDADARETRNYHSWAQADGNYQQAIDRFAKCGDTANQSQALVARDRLRRDIFGWAPAPLEPAPAQCDPAKNREARTWVSAAEGAGFVFLDQPAYANWQGADNAYANAALLFGNCDAANQRKVNEERNRLRAAYNQRLQARQQPQSQPNPLSPSDRDRKASECRANLRYLESNAASASMGREWIATQLANVQCNPDGTPM